MRDFHYEDETVMVPSDLYDGNFYTGKTTSLYWDDPRYRNALRFLGLVLALTYYVVLFCILDTTIQLTFHTRTLHISWWCHGMETALFETNPPATEGFVESWNITEMMCTPWYIHIILFWFSFYRYNVILCEFKVIICHILLIACIWNKAGRH